MGELLKRVFGAPRHGTDGGVRIEQVAADPVLERVVNDVFAQIEQAERQRGPAPLSSTGAAQVQAQTRALIDLPEQQRVLWVDERPEGNRLEAAALAKLQIEVVIARSTDEAMQIVADDSEAFSLVISDWERPGEPAPAGLHLLARLRQVGIHWPLVFYHGANAAQRSQRADQARAAGALGEAVLPSELMALVAQAFRPGPPQTRRSDPPARPSP